MSRPTLIFRTLLATSMLIGLAHAQTTPDAGLPSTDPAKSPELRAGSGYLIGYLPRKDLPNSLQLLQLTYITHSGQLILQILDRHMAIPTPTLLLAIGIYPHSQNRYADFVPVLNSLN